MSVEVIARRKVRDCTRCHLHDLHNGPVPFEGRRGARYCVVGEAPGALEDQKRRPFVGRSGKVLRMTLAQAGIPKREVAFVNVVSCRPPNNRDPSVTERSACRSNLNLQLKVIQPRVLILLGASALKGWRSDWKISEMRGRPLCVGMGLVAVPTYHPAAVLRKPSLREWLIADVKQARDRGRWLDPMSQWPDDCSVCRVQPHEPVEVYDEMGVGYCRKHRALRGRGVVGDGAVQEALVG